MSGSKPTVAIRVTAENADKTRADLERIGTTGEAALKRVQVASAAAAPEMQRLATASDVAQRAFTGLGGSLGRVGAVATNVAGVAGVLTVGFAALGAAAGVAAVNIAKAGDAANATLARLASATGSMAQAQSVYEGLFRLSQQTGVAVADSAGAFSRFSVAAREIGGTSDQVLRLVSGIQKAGIVAGAGAQESAAAVQQLGQALASGVLQGDELRSILENLPQLAQALAREMGVSIARLREMGTEGKLTADVVFPALLKATEKIGTEFDKMPVTMSRAKDILIAATDDFGARLDRITGLSQTFAAFMQQGAAALRAAGSYIAPNEREAADGAVQAAQRQRDGVARQMAAERAASAYGDVPAGLQQAMDIADEDLRAALARQQDILRQDRETRRAEAEDAAAQAREAGRQRADTAYKKLNDDLFKDRKAIAEHKKQIDAINAQEAAGSITAAQAKADRIKADKDLKEGLEKLADAHKSVGKEAEIADAHVKEFLKDQEKQAEAAAKAQEKAADAIKRYHERSFDELVGIGERAFDRLGDAIVDAFVSGSGAAVNFGNVARAIAGSVITDFAKLAIVNPILNGLFTSSSGPRPTLSAALGGGGGLGDLLGLSSFLPKDGILGSLGLGNSLSGLGASIFGTPGVSAATASLFGDVTGIGVGAMAGSPGMLGTFGTSLMGGSSLTLGGAFSGIGMGMGAGSLINSLLGRSSAQQTNGMIGSALGSIGGFLIGGPIGGLIGGALGGFGGGLFGPGEPNRGWGFALRSSGPAGGWERGNALQMTDPFYDEIGRQYFQQATAMVQQVNAYMASRNLNVWGARAIGGSKDGMGGLGYGEAASMGELFASLNFGANDNERLNAALTGKAFDDPAKLQAFVEGFIQVQDTIAGLTDTAAEKLDKALAAVNKQFDDLAAKAREYGLSEDGLAAARERALQATREAAAGEGAALLREMTFGRSSALAPEQQYFAALSTLNQARRDLDAGGSVSSYAAIASQVLPVARDFLGTSTRYAGLAAEVAQAVGSRGGDTAGLSALLTAQVDGSSALQATFAAYGEQSLSVQSETLREMRRLVATMEALMTRQRAA